LERLAFDEDGASDARRNVLVVRIFILLGLHRQVSGTGEAKRVRGELSSVYYELLASAISGKNSTDASLTMRQHKYFLGELNEIA
jgi:hypothetical protein